MAKNISEDSKSLKTMLRNSVNDTWTVDRNLFFCNYNDSLITADGLILDDYYDYFEQFLEEINVPEKFFYSPSYFSEFLYGTPDLDFLILYFAQLSTLFEFNKPRIRVLPKTKLGEINQLMNAKKDIVRGLYQNPKTYKEETL